MEEMLLYHTGFSEIRRPDVHFGRKNADLGQGFYLTPDRDFAKRWAVNRKDMQVYVNTYLFSPGDLNILCLDRDMRWFETIFSYRQGRGDPTAGYDAVLGPIANDTLFDVMGILSSGFLPPERALSLLLLGPEYRQIALRTEKAAEHLHFLSSEILPAETVDLSIHSLRREEEEYRAAFAARLEEMCGTEN